MNKRCDGFIFLMTLCIILVISVLLITCLHHILLYHKALNKQELQHQNFYQLEYLATQLAQTPHLAMDKNCVEPGDAADQVIHQLIHNQGCSLAVGEARYRYIIEDLGDFPCLLLYEQQQKRATRHIRISLLLLADEEHTASALQLRVIKPSIAIGCSGEARVVTGGISSWRYIPAI